MLKHQPLFKKKQSNKQPLHMNFWASQGLILQKRLLKTVDDKKNLWPLKAMAQGKVHKADS